MKYYVDDIFVCTGKQAVRCILKLIQLDEQKNQIHVTERKGWSSAFSGVIFGGREQWINNVHFSEETDFAVAKARKHIFRSLLFISIVYLPYCTC